MNTAGLGQAATQSRRYWFGTRWLLIVMLAFFAVFAWLASESHRVSRQTKLVNDLAQVDIHVRVREPTGLALVARKLLGPKDVWLTGSIGSSWFSNPRILMTSTMTDEQVPDAIELIQRLGGVRELHVEQSPVSQEGISTLKNELPDVAVLTRAGLANYKPRLNEKFAASAFRYMATIGAGILLVVSVLVWPFLRRRFTPKTSSRAGVHEY